MLALGLLLLSSCNRAASETVRFPCPDDPLRGVYDSDRLEVQTPCLWYRGTVVDVGTRSDGDTHLLLKPDPGFSQFLNLDNVNEGGLVVEIMPGQRLDPPSMQEHVAVFGTWVTDTNNGWNEIHPVWGIQYLDSGKEEYSLPPEDPVYQGDSND